MPDKTLQELLDDHRLKIHLFVGNHDGGTRAPTTSTHFVFRATSFRPTEQQAEDGAREPCICVEVDPNILETVFQTGRNFLRMDQKVDESFSSLKSAHDHGKEVVDKNRGLPVAHELGQQMVTLPFVCNPAQQISSSDQLNPWLSDVFKQNRWISPSSPNIFLDEDKLDAYKEEHYESWTRNNPELPYATNLTPGDRSAPPDALLGELNHVLKIVINAILAIEEKLETAVSSQDVDKHFRFLQRVGPWYILSKVHFCQGKIMQYLTSDGAQKWKDISAQLYEELHVNDLPLIIFTNHRTSFLAYRGQQRGTLILSTPIHHDKGPSLLELTVAASIFAYLNQDTLRPSYVWRRA